MLHPTSSRMPLRLLVRRAKPLRSVSAGRHLPTRTTHRSDHSSAYDEKNSPAFRAEGNSQPAQLAVKVDPTLAEKSQAFMDDTKRISMAIAAVMPLSARPVLKSATATFALAYYLVTISSNEQPFQEQATRAFGSHDVQPTKDFFDALTQLQTVFAPVRISGPAWEPPRSAEWPEKMTSLFHEVTHGSLSSVTSESTMEELVRFIKLKKSGWELGNAAQWADFILVAEEKLGIKLEDVDERHYNLKLYDFEIQKEDSEEA